MNNPLNLQKGSWAYTNELTDEQYELLIELMDEAGADNEYSHGLATKLVWDKIFWGDYYNGVNLSMLTGSPKFDAGHPNKQVTSSQLQAILDDRAKDVMELISLSNPLPEPPTTTTKLLAEVMELKALNDQMSELGKRRWELEKSICDALEIM